MARGALSSPTAQTRFARDTAVRPLGGGRFAVRLDEAWWIVAGPNGGYVAALMLRAILAHLDTRSPSATGTGDPARPPRSLTVHFVRPPAAGDAIVAVTLERSGRGLSTLSARLEQDGRVCALALCACAGPYPAAAEYAERRAPEVLPVHALDALSPDPDAAAISGRVEMRQAIGASPLRGDEARTGGWVRLAEDGPLDLPAIALLTDVWWPASWPRLTRISLAPTIDLTIHFRARLPRDAGPWILGEYASPTAHDGYVDEEAHLWLSDGTLLAQARQLALLLPS